jgi:hypothetical protein
VIDKNKEMKFLMMKEKEIIDKSFQEGEPNPIHLIYEENNISCQLFLIKEFYLFFQVMGLLI